MANDMVRWRIVEWSYPSGTRRSRLLKTLIDKMVPYHISEHGNLANFVYRFAHQRAAKNKQNVLMIEGDGYTVTHRVKPNGESVPENDEDKAFHDFRKDRLSKMIKGAGVINGAVIDQNRVYTTPEILSSLDKAEDDIRKEYDDLELCRGVHKS